MSPNVITALSVVVGGVISVMVAMAIENAKRPCIRLSCEPPRPSNWPPVPPRQKQTATFVSVRITNTAAAMSWMIPPIAERCRATVQFFNELRQPVLGDFSTMRGRWDKSPEPVGIPFYFVVPMWTQTSQSMLHPVLGGLMPDFYALSSQEMSIRPQCAEALNIAAQFENDAACFGWCNDNYEQWDYPPRKLDPGNYHVLVTVESLGIRWSRWFLLVNTGHRSGLRVELLEEVGPVI